MHYGKLIACQDVRLSLDSGEIVALLGTNGSGKSSLIKSVLGHASATGKILWDGKPLKQWSKRQLARRVAYLRQAPVYDPGQTVSETLRLGRSPYWSAFGIESALDEQIVREVAAKLLMEDLLNRPLDELSGGQRQRVFIGRCLVQEPAALLLDEPDTYLDLRHQVELCQLLVRLSKEQSIGILMASHDLNLAATYADRVVLLDQGKVAGSGTVDVLEPELLSKVFKTPIRKVEGPSEKPIFVPA